MTADMDKLFEEAYEDPIPGEIVQMGAGLPLKLYEGEPDTLLRVFQSSDPTALEGHINGALGTEWMGRTLAAIQHFQVVYSTTSTVKLVAFVLYRLADEVADD